MNSRGRFGSIKRIAYKRLSDVEADGAKSNQHEINGVIPFQDILGRSNRDLLAVWTYLSDEEDEDFSFEGTLTWYDSRKGNPERDAEFRLYYPAANPVTERIGPGDLLLLLETAAGALVFGVSPAGSITEGQLRNLLTLPETGGYSAGSLNIAAISEQDRNLWAPLLQRLGIESTGPSSYFLQLVAERYPDGFPTTASFSAFARSTLPEIDSRSDPDTALYAWITREELLFRALERLLVEGRLGEGFQGNVDVFVEYALSVLNRRKARAGRALENHVEQLLSDNGISFERGAITELRMRPDFLFPSSSAYHNPAFPGASLHMLGVKASCKDRWRQVLSEAARIDSKHLLTMEPGISTHQLGEMRARGLTLVVPRPVFITYPASASPQLLSVAAFLHLVSST